MRKMNPSTSPTQRSSVETTTPPPIPARLEYDCSSASPVVRTALASKRTSVMSTMPESRSLARR